MSDVVGAFVREEELEGRGDQGADVVEGARPRGAQKGFQFGECLLDGIEVGTVRRQKAHQRPDLLDGGAHLRLFVHGEIVEHDDIARPQRRHEHLLDIGEEGDCVDRTVEDGRRRQGGGAQRRDNRVRLPVSARGVIAGARAAQTARIPANQIGRDPGFVDEDVLPRIVERLRQLPVPAGRRDVRPLLLFGAYGFFLPSRRVDRFPTTPC